MQYRPGLWGICVVLHELGAHVEFDGAQGILSDGAQGTLSDGAQGILSDGVSPHSRMHHADIQRIVGGEASLQFQNASRGSFTCTRLARPHAMHVRGAGHTPVTPQSDLRIDTSGRFSLIHVGMYIEYMYDAAVAVTASDIFPSDSKGCTE